jgi:hypothetical protein
MDRNKLLNPLCWQCAASSTKALLFVDAALNRLRGTEVRVMGHLSVRSALACAALAFLINTPKALGQG